MNDYTLYLVKRAYLKKRAQGITVLGQPIMYDPYSVYKKRKQALIDAIQKPEFKHDNARRFQDEAVASAKRNNLLAGTTTGAIIGGMGGNALDRFGGYAADGRLSKRIPMYLGTTALGSALGAGLGALRNYTHDFKDIKNKAWEKGDVLDREAFQTAQKKYDEDVAKAVRDFNIKYTGMEDPDNDAIYRGGIKLHDEK